MTRFVIPDGGRLRTLAVVASLSAAAIATCAAGASCKKNEQAQTATVSSGVALGASAGPSSSGSASVVAESLPRCRVEGAKLAIPGDDVVVGDAVVAGDTLLVGVVRREGARRLAGIAVTSLDLASMRVVEVGPALGDDPPPSPRVRGTQAFVAGFSRSKAGGSDAGPAAAGGASGSAPGAPGAIRVLDVQRIDGSSLVSEGSIAQQADESLAYDIAWPDPAAGNGAPLVAWDEDAPPRAGAMLADRGVVKVQLLAPRANANANAGTKARVASPESSDAEAPRLLARRGGFWLAWLARRAEAGEDAGPSNTAEGPGERRSYRWVELVALDAKGEATSPVRRISPEKGRASSFDLVASSDVKLVIVVQDEAAHAEGAGERIVRYAIDGEKIDVGDLLDGGVGHALAELLPAAADAAAPRWLAFSDTHEHAHLVPLGPALRLAGRPTLEPSLDGARIVASGPPDVVYAVGSAGAPDAAGTRIELRRLVCR